MSVPSEEPIEPQPIFVVGYMHSGTTLVAGTLKRHPSVLAGRGETKFFDLMPVLRERFADLHDARTFEAFVPALESTIMQRGVSVLRPTEDAQEMTLDPATIRAVVGPRPDHASVIKAVFDSLTRERGLTHWLENTPTHVFHVGPILEVMPNARFIHVVRDGRDILASKKLRREGVKTGRYGDKADGKRMEKAYDPFWDALSWRSAVAAGVAASKRHPQHVHEIKYEELVSDLEKGVRGICDFLDLHFDPIMLDVTWANPAEAERAGQPGVGTQSVGRWKRSLRPAELALAQTAGRSQLQALGYPLADLGPRSWIGAPWVLLRSVGELGRRLVARFRLGGGTYLRTVVRGYARRFARLVGR